MSVDQRLLLRRQPAPAVDRGDRLCPVFCVTDHLYRDARVAQDATLGRFHHLGVTLDLGRRPDWRTNPVADVEWRIEWTKLYEGLHLAHAFAALGDAELLDTWQDLVESFCDQVPVGSDRSDVTARRLQNWLYAWQTFAATPRYPGLRDGLADRLRARIRDDAAHLSQHLTSERNHRTLELYALVLVALALGEQSEAERFLNDLADNAVADIRPDGVHRECSTDYHMIVLRSLIGAIVNARLVEMPVPQRLVERTQLACDFALHARRPDGVTPAVSDGDEEDYSELLALAADVLYRPDLTWASTNGRRGARPPDLLASFPIGGYYVQRSGWGDGQRTYRDERWALFDCGPIGDGGHGHYDQLAVLASADGRALLVDAGRYTYDPESPWRQWFKGTAAHNTVCVDRLDQTPYRPGKPSGETSTATFLGRVSHAGLDLLRGEVRSPAYDAVHVRTVAFVDGDYWIVHDQLRAPTAHIYEARWHLSPEAHDAVVIDDRGTQTTVCAPGVQLIAPAGAGEMSLQPGWFSPTYGTKVPAPIVVAQGVGADVDLLTVLAPGASPVAVQWVCGGGEVFVTVARSGTVDTISWRTNELAGTWVRTPC